MAAVSASPWAPLKHKAFLLLWLAGLGVYLAVWMQNVGAAWLMTSLSATPMMVALIQTATSLPAFLLGLPGGVLSDLVDRRRYLFCTLLWLFVSGLMLVGLTLSGMMTAWILLALTFALGAGIALQTPAWFSSQVEAVPAAMIPAALSLGSVSYNVARAMGPAIAGLMIPFAGVGSVFMLVTACFLLALVAVVFRPWQAQAPSTLPVESLWEGLRTIFRYTRFSPVMRSQSLRTFSFVVSASCLWALLPLVAKNQLSAGAQGYGFLLGSLGIGAVTGAILTPRLLNRFKMNVLVTLSILTFALITAAVSHIHRLDLICFMLFFGGVAWQLVGNFNLSAIQTSVPSWVRGRAMSVYMLVFQGSMAVGAGIWGFTAERLGVDSALYVAAAALIVALLVSLAFPARIGDASEMTTIPREAVSPLTAPISPAAGPVLVELEYFIHASDRADFLEAMTFLGESRRRDGASFWRIYQDVDDPGRIVERFRVDSWSGYLLQQSRRTVKDQEAEDKVLSLHRGDSAPQLRHYIRT